jgi:hypothetical protein
VADAGTLLTALLRKCAQCSPCTPVTEYTKKCACDHREPQVVLLGCEKQAGETYAFIRQMVGRL